MLVTQAEVPVEKWSVPAQAVALVMPDTGMERVARVGRVRGPLLVAMACAVLAAAAGIVRIDARDATLRMLETQGQLTNSSDRQIEDATKAAERVYMVKRVGTALVAPPVQLGLLCVALLALSWFLRGRSQGRAIAAVAAAVLIPGAVADLLEAGATLQRASVAPEGLAILPRTLADFWAAAAGHPLMGPAARLLSAVDVFSLWGALLAGFGLAAAAQLPARRALIATLVAWMCYRLLATVAMGGHP